SILLRGRLCLESPTNRAAAMVTLSLFAVAFSPDGKELRAFKGHGSSITSVAFSRDGARVLTGSLDNTACLWDGATGKAIRAFTGHEETVTSVAFSRDGARVLTGSLDKTDRLWDAATG